MVREDILDILKQQVKPALGCTESVAVALAVSTAYEEVKGNIEDINIKLSPNIYKNGMRVSIPGTKEKSIEFAVALSVVCANPKLGLELFKNINDCCIDEALILMSENKITLEIVDDKGNFFIEATIKTDKGSACCIVKDSHTNIVYLKANDKVVFNMEDKKCAFNAGYNVHKDSMKSLSIKEIMDFIENIPYIDIKFLLVGVELNINMANKGLEDKIGLGAGMSQLLQKGILKDDIVTQVRILTSSACDAKMAGINLSVMSSAGSGNHGITAIIPPTVICRYLGYDDEKLARALAFSHLVTSYIMEYTGKLSPVCGCSVAAGIGASASIAWLLGGNYEQIVGAINNMVGAISGMVCDGAKGGCAYKLSTAASEAVIQAYLAVNDIIISKFDGIVGINVEDTIKNLGALSNEGMKDMDDVILKIMTSKVL
jgi:L-cysteine desulfidase